MQGALTDLPPLHLYHIVAALVRTGHAAEAPADRRRSDDAGMSASAGAIRRLIALFLDMLAAERGAAKNTLLAYGRDLAQASEWLDGGLGAADAAALAQLSAHWAGLARASAARKASAVRQFLGFLASEGHAHRQSGA